MIALDELKIPRELRPVVEQIVGITDSVCLSVLDEEYADLARRAVAKLARKRPSPLQAGRRYVAAQNPLAWIIEVNGLAVDARHVAPDIQAEAFQRGLIPYMPALGPNETAARARSQVTERRPLLPPPLRCFRTLAAAGQPPPRCRGRRRRAVRGSRPAGSLQ